MEKLFHNVQRAIKLIRDNSGGDRRTNHKNVVVVHPINIFSKRYNLTTQTVKEVTTKMSHMLTSSYLGQQQPHDNIFKVIVLLLYTLLEGANHTPLKGTI